MTGRSDDPTEPLRVALVVEQLRRTVPGGIGTYIEGLLHGLADRERDPTSVPLEIELVASRNRKGPRHQQGPDPLERFGRPLRLSPLPGPVLTRLWDLGLRGSAGRADVVHALSLAGPSSWGAGGSNPAQVVTVHDLAWRRHPESSTRRGRRWHEARLRQVLRRSAAFVVPSHQVACELAAAGAPAGSVSVVVHGADHLPAPDGDGARALLHRHGIAGPYLLSVGTLEPRKNLRRLVAAYGMARPSLPEAWPLVVVGPLGWGDPGPWSPEVPRSGDISGAGLPPGVAAVGPVTAPVLAGLYASARVFAYVPLVEGFGLPPMEAMTFGIPVVASTGVPSVVADPHDRSLGPAALLVSPADTEAMAEALVEAATKTSTRSQLAAAGRALVGGRTWRRAAEKHMTVWESLC